MTTEKSVVSGPLMLQLKGLGEFCETQWRHSVKTRLYKTPPPYFILWNAVTSLGENKVI